MEWDIYHGSTDIIEKPVYGKGKRYNDYGLGFYCTEHSELAKEWAVSAEQDGYINHYKIEDATLHILNLTNTEYGVLHWLNILLQNRKFDMPSPLAKEGEKYISQNFTIPYENYDIIIGYRADDSYFSFAQDFLNGTISYRQLNHALHLGNLGEQVVLKSRKAFDILIFCGYEKADKNIWYPRKERRDRTARREYYDMDKNHYQKGDIYITSIIDQEMKTDDIRLR